MPTPLTTTNHDRDSAGLQYVYPVMSRRAGGLSIGINVNTNNACNWRCIYCQVPNLTVGAAPAIDFDLLEDELDFFLNDVLKGDFFERFAVAPDKRCIKDLALSGNGEPTSAKHFDRLITLLGDVAQRYGILPNSNMVLITNGSLIHQRTVQQGLQQLHALGGEIWFKVDSATLTGRQRINNTRQSDAHTLRNLTLAAELCRTKLQTCLIDYADRGWDSSEQEAYLQFLAQVKTVTGVRDIMLYTVARPSLQPEAPQLTALPNAVMQHIADAIRALGFRVSVY